MRISMRFDLRHPPQGTAHPVNSALRVVLDAVAPRAEGEVAGYIPELADADPEPFGELLERVVEYNVQLAAVAKQRYGLQIVATTDDVANATGMPRLAHWWI